MTVWYRTMELNTTETLKTLILYIGILNYMHEVCLFNFLCFRIDIRDIQIYFFVVSLDKLFLANCNCCLT